MPAREFLADCSKVLNYICTVKKDDNALRVTATNKQGTAIHSFEKVLFDQKIDLKEFIGKEIFLGGTLARIEFNDGATTHRIDGRPGFALARLGIACVPAQNVVLPRMTVMENLEVGGRFLLRDRTELATRVDEMLTRFPALGARATGYAGVLSGGEQRQLAIARALIARPRLMLLDEPSIGLAPKILAEIFELLARINAEQRVDILMVEQNVVMALRIAHRGYVMRVGAMDFDGSAAELAASDRLANAYMGS